jgi:ABC-type glycerol-3-phosphate transport system substrate-binding protein
MNGHHPTANRRALLKAGASLGLAAGGVAPIRARAQEAVTVNFITLSEEWADHMQQVVDAFHAATPGVRVELETYPFRQLFEVIEIRMSGQSTDLDVISVDVPLVASYSVRGFLHPLDEYFTPEEIASTWIPAASEAGTHDGQFMAAPQNNSTQFLYVNRGLFQEHGVQPPPTLGPGAGATPGDIEELVNGRWTWEQVVEAAQQLTLDTNDDDVPDVWGFQFDQVSRPYQILALPESLNQPSVSPDGLTTDGYLNSPAWIRAAQFYYDLFNTAEVSPKGVTPEQSSELFATGKAAMFVGGEWNVPPFAESEGLDFGIAAHPYFADGRVATPTGSWHVGVSAFSEHKAEAAQFVKFLTASSEGARTWFEAHGHFPVTTELLDLVDTSEEFASFPSSAYRLGTHEARNTAVPRPQTPGYLEFEDILNNTLEDIRNGRAPEEALNEAVQRIDRALARYRDA